jgi:hypothetical protein
VPSPTPRQRLRYRTFDSCTVVDSPGRQPWHDDFGPVGRAPRPAPTGLPRARYTPTDEDRIGDLIDAGSEVGLELDRRQATALLHRFGPTAAERVAAAQIRKLGYPPVPPRPRGVAGLWATGGRPKRRRHRSDVERPVSTPLGSYDPTQAPTELEVARARRRKWRRDSDPVAATRREASEFWKGIARHYQLYLPRLTTDPLLFSHADCAWADRKYERNVKHYPTAHLAHLDLIHKKIDEGKTFDSTGRWVDPYARGGDSDASDGERHAEIPTTLNPASEVDPVQVTHLDDLTGDHDGQEDDQGRWIPKLLAHNDGERGEGGSGIQVIGRDGSRILPSPDLYGEEPGAELRGGRRADARGVRPLLGGYLSVAAALHDRLNGNRDYFRSVVGSDRSGRPTKEEAARRRYVARDLLALEPLDCLVHRTDAHAELLGDRAVLERAVEAVLVAVEGDAGENTLAGSAEAGVSVVLAECVDRPDVSHPHLTPLP